MSAVELTVVGDWYVIRSPLMLLVLTEGELRKGLSRGTWWARQGGFEQRLAAIVAHRARQGGAPDRPAGGGGRLRPVRCMEEEDDGVCHVTSSSP